MNLLQALGTIIHEQREFMGISRHNLASTCGVHRNTILNTELGRHTPSIALVWEIAEALDMYPHDLICMVEECMELR